MSKAMSIGHWYGGIETISPMFV